MKEDKIRKTRIQRRKEKKSKTLYIVKKIILLIIILILSYLSYGIYKEGKIRTLKSNDYSKHLLYTDTKELDKINVRNIKMPEVLVDNEYKGYKVECRLEIPKIELYTNVLKNYSKEGLDLCASKYYGPSANEIGNYCIAGHNYDKEKMFNHLIDLDIGDSMFLVDNKNGIIEYIIYDIYKVKPNNTTPLSQDTLGQRELTLITCVNYSKNRLVIKGIEKN